MANRPNPLQYRQMLQMLKRADKARVTLRELANNAMLNADVRMAYARAADASLAARDHLVRQMEG